ncbi:Alpha/Beta hydrolase protein [Panaeolus papilionaceus]|nr:Alpha/Beta hydrolase protein [Panaeolus papilionaceus]
MLSTVLYASLFYTSLFLAATALPLDAEIAAELAASNIPAPLYDSLTWYFKYASSAYSTTGCAKPNGKTFVAAISDAPTDTQGYIARDDSKKEIVISFRGSTSVADFITDANILFSQFVSPGVSAPTGVRVHRGFLKAWNSVAPFVIKTVQAQLKGKKGYSIVTTGHSLGGALSSISAMALRENFANVPVRMYTYGQPRTGNQDYATYINSNFGSGKAFRVTHTTDPVVQIPLKNMGYVHHGVEYWIKKDPSSAVNVDDCKPLGEDKNCADQISLVRAFVGTDAHLIYMGIRSNTPFCAQ